MNLVEKAAAVDWGKLRFQTYEGGGFNAFLTVIVQWITIIAGILAFFYLVYAGFTYLTAGGNADNAKKGQQGIINAIIGLIIIILAYAIVRAVISFMNAGS